MPVLLDTRLCGRVALFCFLLILFLLRRPSYFLSARLPVRDSYAALLLAVLLINNSTHCLYLDSLFVSLT
ncbi:uncharacterized protein FA14DRAFT_23277 [Meira miltonrushii]|uniref:Uncharacterized protein n=1 Tax=Meira miltonrushii TaxID=1280837 RepID=A0A316VKN5_9BASI|nr:uncharacterized protein FA14DRAFT_23277 [Meira miltonrushii]PWN38116.1 hypothetical protein FA14DRAFT_23277 [Meira miltonrushii]